MKTDFFLLRTPLFPFNKLHSTHEEILDLFNSSIFKEAIYASSPDLYDRLLLFNEEKIADIDESKKLYKSFYRYLLRMSFRCTPFGLFAGTTLGQFSQSTNIQLRDPSNHKKITRIDSQYLNVWALNLLNKDSFHSVTWYSNNTIYQLGEKIRYVEYTMKGGIRSHRLSTVENSEYLQHVLEAAKNGAEFDQLVNTLISEDITSQESTSFIEELISNKLLVSDLELNITGELYHETLADKINKEYFPVSAYNFFKNINTRIATFNSLPLGSASDDYQQIVDLLQESKPDEMDNRMLLQTDLNIAAATCSLDESLKTEIIDAVIFLARTSSKHENLVLKRFKEEFYKRYETSEVPLSKVLDPDCGIGYPPFEHAQGDISPIAEGIVSLESQTQENSYTANYRDHWLVQKLVTSQKNGFQTIELSQEDIPFNMRQVSSQEILQSLPRSLFTICNVIKDGDRSSLVYSHTNGPSGVNTIGRFCHENPVLHSKILEHINEEENQGDIIYAEVVHFSQSRQANILFRPVLRKYEIPILTNPGVEHEQAIHLSDIYVSLREDQIILTSKRLGKRIIPRLSNAHNYSANSLPHYHFLCDIQTQERKIEMQWNWGLLSSQVFLPRVTYKKIILSLAQWRIHLEDLFSDREKKILLPDFLLKFSKFKAYHSLPEMVLMTSGDNQIPLDLKDSMALEILYDELKKVKSIVLKECIFKNDNLIVNGPSGGHTNEVVIPWINIHSRPFLPYQSIPALTSQRNIIIGDEWLYFKIYCGVKSADNIISEIISPLTCELTREKVIDKWFFIRYADPDHHIRLRLRCPDKNNLSVVVKRMNDEIRNFIDQGIIWKLQCDTYQRELERYHDIQTAENIFSLDSICVSKSLILLKTNGKEDEFRWQLAICGIERFLNDLGFKMEEKIGLFKWLSAEFAMEFNVDKSMRKNLSNRYRELKYVIDMIITPDEQSNYLSEFNQFFEDRSSGIKSLKIKDITNELTASFIHMHLNRMFRSKQRFHEMIIYDLLHRHYVSLSAKKHYLAAAE